MEINRANIYELVNRCQVKPDKDYGQNFLLEPLVAKKIVDALEAGQNESTLEIGPGLGSLTHFLFEQTNLTVCDIDSRMIDFLKIFYENKIEYVLNDVRKIDISKYDKIIGNLPYNITTELVTFLLLNAKQVKRMVLMCQLEAFNRFYDLSGENYGPVSILLHLLGDVQKLFVVKAGSFYPAPKCQSVVFTFSSNLKTEFDTAVSVYKLAKSIFLNRRKTIANNLKNVLSNSYKANEVLSELNIDPMVRPENISPEIYLKMYLLIQNKL